VGVDDYFLCGESLSIKESFAENTLKSFQKINKEIEKGSSEHDVRYRFDLSGLSKEEIVIIEESLK